MSVCSIVRMVKSFMEYGRGKGELGNDGDDDDLVWDMSLRWKQKNNANKQTCGESTLPNTKDTEKDKI